MHGSDSFLNVNFPAISSTVLLQYIYQRLYDLISQNEKQTTIKDLSQAYYHDIQW